MKFYVLLGNDRWQMVTDHDDIGSPPRVSNEVLSSFKLNWTGKVKNKTDGARIIPHSENTFRKHSEWRKVLHLLKATFLFMYNTDIP